MKFTLIASAALALAPLSASAAPAPATPVGTWEVTLTGADQGTAYVTFEDDNEFSGYGLSRNSLGLFTLSGTWTVDAAGKLTGNYTETINGDEITGTLTGKVAAKKITGSIASTIGSFKFNAKREVPTQSISGVWTGATAVGKVRMAEFYQITPSAFPHLYEISGEGTSLLTGSYSISGVALVGSKGKIRLAAVSIPDEDEPSFSSLTGTVNVNRKQNVLKGTHSSGLPIKVALAASPR
ncbi:hypothetical protein OKA04_08400 [Luteolibacter flavescens]|uniref:Lipocalin-like domain-containing protein n=1 Tax=Luteolibacter flavescens TaxID=1859460 RepID=A0ABT3FME5_9BACT|nr:hypothetical protein [Luteolibacter flavescens]MCW1884746.1 hypothetical protein [Luteolibacter flavescens]